MELVKRPEWPNNMEIAINDAKTIGEIQYEFSIEFPYLKIEFFGPGIFSDDREMRSRKYPAERKISNCRKMRQTGHLNIDKNRTVSDLEEDLKKNFGLRGYVYRKSGKLWIETELTHTWTLEQQNKEGWELSSLNNGVKR